MPLAAGVCALHVGIAVSAGLDSLTDDVASLQDTISALDVGTLTTDVAALDTRLTTAEGTITSQGTTLSSHTTTLSSQATTLTTIGNDLDTAEAGLATLNTQVTGHETRLDAVDGRLDGLDAAVAAAAEGGAVFSGPTTSDSCADVSVVAEEVPIGDRGVAATSVDLIATGALGRFFVTFTLTEGSVGLGTPSVSVTVMDEAEEVSVVDREFPTDGAANVTHRFVIPYASGSQPVTFRFSFIDGGFATFTASVATF